MANPRKFSEKIALLHQKQAEETAAFEQIMREVSDVTNKPEETGQYGMVGAGAGGGAAPPSQPQARGRPAGVGPMRARPQDRKIDTSPYGSTYLSPPADSSWRRTNSDSALHQSSVAPRDQAAPGGSPHYAGLLHQHALGPPPPQLQHQHHHYSHSHHALGSALQHSQHSQHRRDGNLDGIMSMIDSNPNRPRSSCEAPRVPGIHIYPSAHEAGTQQIPVGNTGSLPDLTSKHFPPPMHGHLDRDGLDHSGSPYSTSPVSASPATLSPTSVPPLRQGHSPHHSPHSSSQAGSPTTSVHHYSNHHTPQNHLSVPNSNSYPHYRKSVGIDQTWIQSGYQQQCSPPSLHSSHSNINIPSPTMGVAPAQVSNGGGGYRSPRSPGSSPGGGGGGDSPHYDAGSYSQQATDNYYINQALLYQHMEQCSMDWAQLVQSLVDSGVTWTAQVQLDTPATSLSYINSVNTNQSQFTQATLPGGEGGGGGGVWAGGGPCVGGPLPQPNTPTIPDIILTDFSNPNSGNDLGKELSGGLASQFSKELSAGLGHHFDPLFPEDDEGLRDGLDPIDFDGLQMLTDPDMNVISDPTTEDAFRLDRL